MTTNEKKALSHIRGVVDCLLTYGLSRRVSGAALGDACLWRSVYHETGLSFTAAADSATLRALTKSGFLEADGKTKSQGHRLTWKGILATQPEDGDNAGEILCNLETLAEMPEHDLTVGSGIEGFRIVPEEIEFIANGKNPVDYSYAIGWARVSLAPLLAMQWIRIAYDSTARLWAVNVTDAGRAISTTPPNCLHDLACGMDIDAWEAGYLAADRIATSKPPAWTENRVPFFLSSGAAWQRIGDYTVAKAEQELETATKKTEA